MRMKIVTVLILALTFTACKHSTKDSTVIDLENIDLTDKGAFLNELDTIGTGIPIFYNMYLSVELSSMFETAEAVFNKELLNAYDKTSQYITSYKRAMNLGVYAVDLSYCRAFEQFDVAGRYFSAMRNLSQQLGIPQNYFEETSQRFEKNLTNKDSLITIANEIYYETEEYLKENERFATASVIIMGGWVEAVFIGTIVAAESRNPDIIERIIDQKYSLNNLLIMLKEYESNEMISDYIHALMELRELYYALKIEIPADFDVDVESNQEKIDAWIVEVNKINSAIANIRKSIIE